jgi:CBS-domain-containing membrane protein
MTGDEIAQKLGMTRAALRPDLTVLTRTGILTAKPRVGYCFEDVLIVNQQVDLLSQILVRDWMGIPPLIETGLSVYDAVVQLFKIDVGSLFVMDEAEGLVGIVSRKDLLKIAMGFGDVRNLPVTVVMTRMPNIITIQPDDHLWTAVRKLNDHEIDSLPVGTWEKRNGAPFFDVIGRFTKTTIVRMLVEKGSKDIKSISNR